ncbi:MAG TPA: 3-oxoacyl-[acyl-carrier-protein] synthase III C-terminal domain-containing protein [Candidatus Dormibacteraeota bacterium]|jgi:alkylresorcinol/alkylpyrone synthase
MAQLTLERGPIRVGSHRTGVAITGLATAVPAVRVDTNEVWTALARLRGRGLRHRPAPTDGSRTRYFAEPLEAVVERRSQSQQTDAYVKHARILSRQVAADALERSGVDRDSIGLVIGVSCTGVILPSLDAELIPQLGLRADVARLPITELGCGGGVAGLARAQDYLRAYPDRAVLLFAVELPSLTFQPDDRSADNLIAAMVFGDGAGGAVLQAGDASPGWVIEQSGSVLVPEGARQLGYELRDGGLRVVLSRELPGVVQAHLRGVVDAFLERAELRLSDLDFIAAHPGGSRIFDAIERSLGLDADALAASRAVFANVGNPSSAGIFFVLEAIRPARPSRGLAIAFGPGLSIELALMRFQ